MIKSRLACLLLAMAASHAGAEGIYKWTDAQGRVHFGDRPPGEGRSAPITPPTAPVESSASDTDRAERRQRLLDMYRDERLEKQEREAKQKADEEDRRRRCAQARDRLARYEQSGRVYEPLPSGERRYLSDGEVDAEIRTTRNEIARWCKP